MDGQRISAAVVGIKAGLGTRTGRLIGVIALGLMLAGCDKCNDWRIFNQAGPQMCKGTAPIQQ